MFPNPKISAMDAGQAPDQVVRDLPETRPLFQRARAQFDRFQIPAAHATVKGESAILRCLVTQPDSYLPPVPLANIALDALHHSRTGGHQRPSQRARIQEELLETLLAQWRLASRSDP